MKINKTTLYFLSIQDMYSGRKKQSIIPTKKMATIFVGLQLESDARLLFMARVPSLIGIA